MTFPAGKFPDDLIAVNGNHALFGIHIARGFFEAQLTNLPKGHMIRHPWDIGGPATYDNAAELSGIAVQIARTVGRHRYHNDETFAWTKRPRTRLRRFEIRICISELHPGLFGGSQKPHSLGLVLL